MVISSKEFFDNRLIRSHTNHIHPPRSLDLAPLDYFLFLTLKKHQKVFEDVNVELTCVEGRFQRSL
jgi:hypothetical protein